MGADKFENSNDVINDIAALDFVSALSEANKDRLYYHLYRLRYSVLTDAQLNHETSFNILKDMCKRDKIEAGKKLSN